MKDCFISGLRFQVVEPFVFWGGLESGTSGEAKIVSESSPQHTETEVRYDKSTPEEGSKTPNLMTN